MNSLAGHDSSKNSLKHFIQSLVQVTISSLINIHRQQFR